MCSTNDKVAQLGYFIRNIKLDLRKIAGNLMCALWS